MKKYNSAYDQMLQFNKDSVLGLKDIYKSMQLWQLKNGKNDGVFCPTKVSFLPVMRAMQITDPYALVRNQTDESFRKQVVLLSKMTLTHIYGVWRNTLGIYRIDSDIYKQIEKSNIPLDTPMSIYSRLPEWCVYIELPQDNNLCPGVGLHGFDVDGARGFWAYLDYNSDGKRKLSLCLDYIATDPVYNPFELNIDNAQTLQQALELNDEVMLKTNEHYSKLDKNNAELAHKALKYSNEHDKALVSMMLSLLLWLCAEEPDITNIKGEPVTGEQLRLPRYSRNKKTGMFVAPNAPTVFNIGKRLGGEIRQFNERNGTADTRVSSRKRPHIRRGHWHGVWKGADQDKQFKVYWQPAIFVNAYG